MLMVIVIIRVYERVMMTDAVYSYLHRGTSEGEAVSLFLREASSLEFYGMTVFEVWVSYNE